MKKRGFTLVEIIVVLVIIAVLAAALIPTMSGVIKRADDSKMITETRTLLSSVQYLLSEHYVATGVEGDTDYVMDYDEAVALADVPGKLEAVSYEGIMDVTHLQYSRGDRYCLYCHNAAAGLTCGECGNTTAFTVTDDANAYLVNMIKTSIDAVYATALANVASLVPNPGNTINSIYLDVEGSGTASLFDSVPADTKAFLKTVTWKLSNDAGKGVRLYFTLENYGTGSSDGAVRVYKYANDGTRQGFQYNDAYYVQDGRITFTALPGKDNHWYGDDNTVDDWSDTVLLP